MILPRNVFQRVGEIGFAMSVQDQPRMHLSGVVTFELRRSQAPSRRTLSGQDGHFVWACTREKWFTNAAMLEPFRRGKVGHQYPTDEGIDDALIEVSFGET